MKARKISIFFLLFAGLFCLQSRARHVSNRDKKKCTVIIDPGHGGSYKGCASYHNKYLEKNMVLDIAIRLEKILQKEPIRVLMTRYRDTHLSDNIEIDLNKRIDKARIMHADIFVSIHLNSAPNKRARGFEVFVPPKHDTTLSGKDGQKSQKLAHIIHDKLRHYAQSNAKFVEHWDRGIKPGPFRVLKNAVCPAVLVELEFITNPDGAAAIAQRYVRQKYAYILAEAIMDYSKAYGC